MKYQLRYLFGFTLIELLVVISIIGILVAVIMPNFTGSRDEARNVALQAELKEVQLALELYKAQNGSYPVPANNGASCYSAPGGVRFIAEHKSGCENSNIATGLVPEFIASMPSYRDSANTNCSVVYKTDATQSVYKLTAVDCHQGTALTQTEPLARCPSSCSTAIPHCDPDDAEFQNSYAVYNLGIECE